MLDYTLSFAPAQLTKTKIPYDVIADDEDIMFVFGPETPIDEALIQVDDRHLVLLVPAADGSRLRMPLAECSEKTFQRIRTLTELLCVKIDPRLNKSVDRLLPIVRSAS